MLAAAFTVMERTQRLLVEAEREVKDFWAGERGEHIGVGSEVGVDIVQVMICRGGGGRGYSGGSGGANKDISCGGGGGSFNNGTNQQNECCYNTAGHGKVIITFLH